MKEIIYEKAKDLVDEKDLNYTATTLNQIADVVECVEIDQEKLKNKIIEELRKKSNNPFNALLQLLGLRMVNINNPEKSFGCVSYDKYDGASAFTFKDLLKLNDRFDRTYENIADSLVVVEKSLEARNGDLEKALKMLDKKSSEFNNLKVEYEHQRQEILERAQYILSVAGENTEDDSLVEQVVEMLADIGVTVFWSVEGADFSERVMFDCYKVRSTEDKKVKPCFVADGKVVLKGLKFISE